MEVFVARQAIFDRQLKVYGYELLYRACLDSTVADTADSMASLQVITNSLLSMGIDRVLAGKRAFVNFPQELLADERSLVLPPKIAVIELLETVKPEPAVIDACRALHKKGYMLALDDFADSDGWDKIIDLVSIIKVDFRTTLPNEQRALVKRYGPRGIRMLGEKIETQEEFQQAREMGYHYFQGHFFERPKLLSRQEIPVCKLNYLKILKEMQGPELDYPAIEALIRREVSLVSKLLRFINSALFGWKQPVQSIVQALTVLGEQEIRHWVSLAALPSLTVDKPDELMRTALVRTRFCELLAPFAGLGHRKSDLFLIGLLSLLDAMLDRPLGETLAELKLDPEMAATLLGKAAPGDRLADVYALIRAYESGQWETVAATADLLRLPKDIIPELYLNAVTWSEQIFRC